MLGQMKLQQGQSITQRMLMLYPLGNYVLLFEGTLAFTARQYCLKQQEQMGSNVFTKHIT